MMMMVMADEWMATVYTVWSEDGDEESKGDGSDVDSFKAVIINTPVPWIHLGSRPWQQALAIQLTEYLVLRTSYSVMLILSKELGYNCSRDQDQLITESYHR
jgi:hypothetical protein